MVTEEKRSPTETPAEPGDSSKITILPIRRREQTPPADEQDGGPPDFPPPAA